MKSPVLKSENNKGITICLLLLVDSSSAFSQNKIAALVSSVRFEYALPIVCVLGVALFMLNAFMKQKDH